MYTRKDLVIMETSISEFRKSVYTTPIQNLAFNVPTVRIRGNHNYGNTLREAFEHCELFQYVLCHSDYLEQVVASFAHQIKSKYYGRNRSVYI